MSKVVVFEDGNIDACDRYGSLLENHDVHLFYLVSPFRTLILREIGGFKESQIYPEVPEKIMEADFYFTDGLNGKCFDILPRLPRDKTFVVSGSFDI